LVSVVSEHRAVLDPLAYLELHGFPLTLLPIGPKGQVNLKQLEQALGPDVLLLSVMAANNEIGVVAPLQAIAALCKAQGVLLHCDAAQGAGHIPLSMADLEIDLLSISGHKLYGPKGIGALLVRPGVPLAPQLHGGNQQDGLRAGTLPVPLVVGLGAALEHAMADREARALRLGGLRDQLWSGLAALGGLERNGDPQACLPHNLNITVAGVDGTQLHQRLRPQLAVSSGSACSQGSPSPVLAALGRTRQEAAASVRFGLGRATSPAEIALAIATVREAVHALRA
jgi:cysteine desulfurase